MDVSLWIGALVIGYLLGSIPFGLVITRLAGLGDIRAIGSGNIGATNVLRTGRKDLALATLLLDSGKAGLACLLCGWGARLILEAAGAGVAPAELADAPFRTGLTAGAAAFVGHCFPVWLRFRGGKGVATFIGLLLAAMWQVGLIFALTWLATAAAFRMSSLAALIAALLAPVSVLLMGYGPFAVSLTSALVALIVWLHRANISRIMSGAEPRIGARKKD
jgi:glycerol-3-phosphate acyltransferase PlsY